MLNKLLARPLELTIGELTLKLDSLAEFEFSMAGRSAVSSDKFSAMVKFSPDQLKQEAKAIKEVEKRFVGILAQCVEEPGSINAAMQKLDPLLFSQDHGWREIMIALNNGDENYDPYRRIALVKYMQYLSARQGLVKYLYSERKKQQGRASDESLHGPILKETPMPDAASKPLGADSAASSFERIPKGEAVSINLPPGGALEVLLSRHKCRIVAGEPLAFVDHRENSFSLEKGRSTIGRDNVSTVMLDDPALRDVSRLHLIIENLDGHAIQLTDISSHGTFIEAGWLAQHSGR